MIDVTPDLESVTDEALAELRRLTVHKILAEAPVFGTWLHTWCDDEAARRYRGETHVLVKHDLALPPCPLWLDDDLADALVAVTTLSYVTTDAAVGALVDRWVLSIAEHAAQRLKERK